MSHWTKVKTKVSDFEMLKKALSRMNLSFEEGEFTIEQDGRSEKAEIRIGNAVGMQKQADGTFAMIGDPYYSTSMKKYYSSGEKKFNTDLSTAYAVEKAKRDLEAQNFYCSENEQAIPGEDGMIRMIYQRY